VDDEEKVQYICYQWLPKPSRKEGIEPRFCPTADSEGKCKSKLTPLMNEDRVVNLKCNEKMGEIAYFFHYPIGSQGRPFTPMTVSLVKRDPLPRDSLYRLRCAIPSRSEFLKVASYGW